MTERIMGTGRLEAFSDGVIAILITIMVLELKVPASHEPAALLSLWPVFVSYLLSFLVIAIYWVNHHGLFHRARAVNNAVLWTNMAFLFCISLIPFATAYMGENRFAPFATALYAGSLLLAGLSFVPMRRAVERQLAHDVEYRRIGRRAAIKNWISVALYAVGVPLAYVHPAITLVLAWMVAAIYFLPNAWLGERAKV
jgi:TMEM175 potassium channel family protein